MPNNRPSVLVWFTYLKELVGPYFSENQNAIGGIYKWLLRQFAFPKFQENPEVTYFNKILPLRNSPFLYVSIWTRSPPLDEESWPNFMANSLTELDAPVSTFNEDIVKNCVMWASQNTFRAQD